MKQIILTQGQVALVDDGDYERVNQFKWHMANIGKSCYAFTSILDGGKFIKIGMHSFIMGGKLSAPLVDHRDGDGLNNQRLNLRIATYSQNNRNARPSIGGISNFKGVSWDKSRGKWVAKISDNGRTIHFKRFDTELEAAHQYDIWAKELFGEFAWLNFVV